MAVRILLRKDTNANWSLYNPILAHGEIIYVTDTNKLKIGDGIHTFLELPEFPQFDSESIYPDDAFEISNTSITLDGTEQTILSYNPTLSKEVSGWIDFTNVTSGDTIIVKIKLNDILHSSQTFSNTQTNPMVYIDARPVKASDTYAITIQQTAGTYRNIGYKFIGE